MQLAVQEINESGGIKGKQIRLIVEDTKSELKATATAINKLALQDRVLAIVGPNWSEFTEVAAPAADQYKVPLIAPSGYTERAFTENGYAFTLWASADKATASLANYINRQKHKRIAVLVSANSYFEQVFQAIKNQLSDRGKEIVMEETIIPGSADYRSLISRIKLEKADAVLGLLMESGEFASFLRQARDLKLGLPMYGANAIPYDRDIQSNPSIAEGTIYFDYPIQGDSAFQSRLKEKFKGELGHGSGKAYDAVYLIKRAATECSPTREKVKECLHRISHRGQSGEITFDKRGIIENPSTPTVLFQIKDGKFQNISD